MQKEKQQQQEHNNNKTNDEQGIFIIPHSTRKETNANKSSSFVRRLNSSSRQRDHNKDRDTCKEKKNIVIDPSPTHLFERNKVGCMHSSDRRSNDSHCRAMYNITHDDAVHEHADNDDDELLQSQQLQWPEDRKSQSQSCTTSSMNSFRLVCSNWTYSYMRRVLQKGALQHKNETQGNTNTNNNQKLEQTDLFRAPSDMEADHVRKLFWEYYNSDKHTNGNGKDKQHKHIFIKTLWHLAAPTFIPAGVCQLVALCAQISIPLLVMQLLRILEEFPMENVVLEALPYTMGIFVAVVVNVFMNHRHHHLAYRSGVVMRVAVMSAIYDQSVRLSSKGRESITSGQVVNLVAIDTQKVSV
jgi:hypothetical protein